jgi:hypothetical protein
MKETAFYPRYTIRSSADVLSISLGLTIVLAFSFLKFGAILLNFAVLVGLIGFIIFFSRLYIRRIVFTPSYFLVEKYVWSPKKIGYSEVIDMGIWTIKTKKGDINLAAMTNVAQLHSMFIELMKEHKVDVDQSENQALREELVLDQSFWPTIIISAVLIILFFIYDYYSESRLHELFFFLIPIVIVLVVSFVVNWFYQRRIKDQ